MSKSFPGTARKYDLYVAFPEAVTLGRVMFVGRRRFVVRETFDRAAWDAERAIVPEGGPFIRRLAGVGSANDRPSEDHSMPVMVSPEPPPVPDDLKFFYGADYI